MSDSLVLSPSQMIVALSACVEARAPALVKGQPGVGKTDIGKHVAKQTKHNLILSHPPVEDPTDSKGIPWYDVDQKQMRFMPVGQIARALASLGPTVWMIDDLGQAAESVQKAYMQWLLAREVDGNRLPDHVTMLAMTNRRSDRAGVSGLLEPVKSRFVTILELATNNVDWANWAIDNGLPPELIAYLRDVQADALCPEFKPTPDITNSPCPRTWAHVGRILQMNVQDRDVRHAMICGAVGEAHGTAFTGFLDIIEKAPSADEVIKAPKTTKIPDDLGALYALSSTLAHRAEPKNFGAIATYCLRMHKEAGKGEFVAYLLRDALRRNRALKDTPEFAQLAKTEIAKDVFAAIQSSAS